MKNQRRVVASLERVSGLRGPRLRVPYVLALVGVTRPHGGAPLRRPCDPVCGFTHRNTS